MFQRIFIILLVFIFHSGSAFSRGITNIRTVPNPGFDVKKVSERGISQCWAVGLEHGNPAYMNIEFDLSNLGSWIDFVASESIIFHIDTGFEIINLKPSRLVNREQKLSDRADINQLRNLAKSRGYSDSGPFISGLNADVFRVASRATAVLPIGYLNNEPIFRVDGELQYHRTFSVTASYDVIHDLGAGGISSEYSFQKTINLDIAPSIESFCPNGDSDGANCRYEKPESWVDIFEWSDNLYSKSQPHGTCVNNGSFFDGANCFLGKPLANTDVFEYNNNMYTSPQCPRATQRNSSTVIFPASTIFPDGQPFRHSIGSISCHDLDDVFIDLTGPDRDLFWYLSQPSYFIGVREVRATGNFTDTKAVGEWHGRRFTPTSNEPSFISEGKVTLRSLFAELGIKLKPNSQYEIKTVDHAFQKPNRIFAQASNNIESCSPEFSSGSYSPSYPSSNAFDNNNSSLWISEVWVTPAIIGYNFSEPKIVQEYTISYANGSITKRAPKDFELQGSNDGVTWNSIDIRSDETNWAGVESRTYTVTETNDAYHKFRLVVNDDNDAREGVVVISIAEIDFKTN